MALFRNIVKRGLCLAAALSVLAGTVVYAEPDDSEAQTADAVGTSLYNVSTALTAFASNVVGANVNDKHVDTAGADPDAGGVSHRLAELSTTNAGNGGAIVGYGDKEKGFVGYIASNETRSVTTSSYGAYLNIGDGGNAYAYARYGRLLNDLGIDSTGNASSAGAMRGMGRFIQGSYLVASFIPKSFSVSLNLLKTLNPFGFFIDDDAYETKNVSTNSLLNEWEGGTLTPDGLSGAVTSVTETETAQQIDGLEQFDKDGGPVGEALQKISRFVTPIYLNIRKLGMFGILPLLLVLMLYGIFTKYRGGNGGGFAAGTGAKILVWVERLAFISVGIPLLGLCYTSVLDAVDLEIQQRPPSARIVAATFVDFENWVKTSRLEPPENVVLESVGGENETDAQGKASPDSWRTVRDTVYAINKRTGLYSLPDDSGLGIKTDGSNIGSNEFDVNAGMWKNGEYSEFHANAGAGASDDEISAADKKMFNRLNALLGSFAEGEFYTASAWDSNVNAALRGYYEDDMGAASSTEEAADSSLRNTVYQMYYDTDEVNDWMNRAIEENRTIFDGTAPSPDGGDEASFSSPWTEKPWNIFTNGSKLVDGSLAFTGDSVDPSATIKFKGNATASGVTNAIVPSANGGNTNMVKTGLSTLSMYNYLSSAFNQSNIAVYSAANTTSEYTRLQHYSANVAGSGVTSVAFLVNTFVCLGIFVLLGIFYCFGLLWRNIKTGLKLIMAVPGAMLGLMKSIAQILAYVVTMISEILSTIILYQVIMELIMVFATIVEGPIMDAVSNVEVNGAYALTGGIFASGGVNRLAGLIAGNQCLFVIALLGAIILITLAGLFIWKLRRPILTAWAYVSIKLMRHVTFTEFLPVFDAIIAKDKSLYVWDNVIEDFRQALKKTAGKKRERDVQKGFVTGKGVIA